MNLAVTNKDGAALAANSLTSVGNLIHSSIFDSIEIKVNGVSITTGANLYPFASYINKLLNNTTAH